MGGNWYDFSFFGFSGVGGVQNGDGSVTVPGTGARTISTAFQDVNKPDGWGGTAFGGGAYIEAEFSFANATNGKQSEWPAFWANDIENMSPNKVTSVTQWPGQPSGYGNWIETDFFEYDRWVTTAYGIQIHNWYGMHHSPQDVTSFSNPVNVPAGFNWADHHKYGFLWVPAANGVQGYAQMYLDGAQVGPTIHWDEWSASAPPLPPPVRGSTAVSILDTRHLALIFQTGPQNPMTVYSVSVWQSSAAGNLTQ